MRGNQAERRPCCHHILAGHCLTVGAMRERVNKNHVIEDVALCVVDKILPRFWVPAPQIGTVVRVRRWKNPGARVMVRIFKNRWERERGRLWLDGGALHGGRLDGGRSDRRLLGRVHYRSRKGSLDWLVVRSGLDVVRDWLRRNRWAILPPVVVKDVSRGEKLWVGGESSTLADYTGLTWTAAGSSASPSRSSADSTSSSSPSEKLPSSTTTSGGGD